MKKTITMIVSLFAIMSFSTSAWAASTWSASPAGGGGTITIGGTTDGFSYTPSPGVVIQGANDDTAYTIVTANTKAGASAMGYSVCSALGGVAQKALTLAADATSPGATLGTTGQYANDFATK